MHHPTPSRAAILIAAISLLAACGGDDDAATTTPPATSPATSAAASTSTGTGTSAVGAGPSVEVVQTSLGQVLASDGLTLYIFTPDEGGTPTCVDDCAGIWPPLLGESAAPGDGVDAAGITAVERPDGTTQLAYHGWPLYFYAADRAAGDVTGQGVGGKWFVIGADGTPIEA